MESVQWFVSQYGYAAVYLLLALGIIGLPVPDELLVIFIGYLASIQLMNYPAAFLVGILGSVSGMAVSYTLGRKVGKLLLWRYGKWIKLTQARLQRVESWFNRYGSWTIHFGYFVPGFRHVTSYLAGSSGMEKHQYFLFATIGAILWVTIFMTIGYLIGDRILYKP